MISTEHSLAVVLFKPWLLLLCRPRCPWHFIGSYHTRADAETGLVAVYLEAMLTQGAEACEGLTICLRPRDSLTVAQLAALPGIIH